MSHVCDQSFFSSPYTCDWNQWRHVGRLTDVKLIDDIEMFFRRYSLIGQINNMLRYFVNLDIYESLWLQTLDLNYKIINGFAFLWGNVCIESRIYPWLTQWYSLSYLWYNSVNLCNLPWISEFLHSRVSSESNLSKAFITNHWILQLDTAQFFVAILLFVTELDLLQCTVVCLFLLVIIMQS